MASHTWEKLFNAVRSLVSKHDIRDRVNGAYDNLVILKVEDFPEELQQDVRALRERVSSETAIREVVNGLSNDELESISYKFLDLYDEICRFHSS